MTNILELIRERSSVDIFNCYQCGKCSAGCPIAKLMPVAPNRIIRLLQLGEVEQALAQETIWQCVSCMTCWARCPRDINLANLMEALRFFSMDKVKADHCQLAAFATGALEQMPQQGMIAALRKVTY